MAAPASRGTASHRMEGGEDGGRRVAPPMIPPIREVQAARLYASSMGSTTNEETMARRLAV